MLPPKIIIAVSQPTRLYRVTMEGFLVGGIQEGFLAGDMEESQTSMAGGSLRRCGATR
jgi:hypothetical protein